MAKSFETVVEFKGVIGSSFIASFNEATNEFSDLKTQARAVQKEIDRLGRDFRQGKIHQSQYTEEVQKLSRELNKLENAQNRLKSFNTALSNVKSTLATGWNTTKAVASIGAITAATATAAATLNSINTAADFEAMMSKVSAITESTASEMKELRQVALELGSSTSLSASEVATAMTELGAKGLDAQEIIAAMPGIISAAEASGEDLSAVSDVVTSAINAFGMGAEETAKVADIMAMSANKTAAGVEDLGYSFKYAAPIAKSLGIDIEELAAVTGILVDKGLAGEQAGTALRMALIRLSNPPKEAQKTLDKLGISVTNSNNKFKSLAEITDDWNKATSDLTDTQKVQYASTVFGTEAATAMINIFEAGTDSIDEMTEALEKSGGAAETAASKMMDNYAGAKEQLLGSIESAQIAFATPILPVLEDTFNGISSMINANLGEIEEAGQAVADVLEEITKPFTVTKPTKPVITPEMNFREVDEAMSKYQQELADFEKFGDMGIGDKVEYMLETSLDKMKEWITTDGREVISEVFSEFGSIAASAWIASFSAAGENVITSIGEGDISGSVVNSIILNALTGGLLLKGIGGIGKWGWNKGKDILGKNTTSKTPDVNTNTKTTVPDTDTKTNTNTNTKSVLVDQFGNPLSSTKNTPTNSIISNSTDDILKSVSKGFNKVVVPLGIMSTVTDIASSEDKAEAIGSNAGGWAGFAGGAALGSFIPIPIVGNLVGGIIGSVIGSEVGSAISQIEMESPSKAFGSTYEKMNPLHDGWDNSKVQDIVNQARNASKNEESTSNLNTSAVATPQSSSTLDTFDSEVSKVTGNLSLLSMYTAQASGKMVGPFYQLEEKTNLVTHNMDLLSSYVGQASGWFVSLMNVMTAGQRVVDALNNLEQRINNVQLPSEARLSYDS